jgi:hypothetical protein
MNAQLKAGDHVIIRAVYTKGVKPKFNADICTDTDYIGTTGIIDDIKGDQALVTIALAHINGQPVHGSHKLIFAVGMLEAR